MPTHCGCNSALDGGYCTCSGAGTMPHAGQGESLTLGHFGYMAGTGLLVMPTPATSMTSGDLGVTEFRDVKMVVPGAGLEPA